MSEGTLIRMKIERDWQGEVHSLFPSECRQFDEKEVFIFNGLENRRTKDIDTASVALQNITV